MLRIRNISVVLAVLLAAGFVLAQTPKEPPPKKEPAEKKPATLEEVLAKALRDNPDIRVAEAKVREAEAELNRTRLTVAQKVIATVTALDAARKAVEVAEEDYQRIRKLQEKAAVSGEAVRAATLKLAQAKAEVARLEAELPLLFGRLTDREETMGLPGPGPKSGGTDNLSRAAPPKPAISVLMAATIRKGLEKEVTFPREIKGAKLIEVMDNLFAIATPGFSYHLLSGEEEPFKDDLKTVLRVPLGAALQLIEDTFPDIRFVVREYGIVGGRSKDLPPDAIRVMDFWRAGNEAPARAAADALNPPKEMIEGTVSVVEKDTGLVKISIGSDAGLKEGHTLEVFRLNPAKYLGTLRIVQVTAKEAVGKMMGRPLAPVEVGDRVASRIKGN